MTLLWQPGQGSLRPTSPGECPGDGICLKKTCVRLGLGHYEEEGQIPVPVQEAGAKEVLKLWLIITCWGGRYQSQVQQAG